MITYIPATIQRVNKAGTVCIVTMSVQLKVVTGTNIAKTFVWMSLHKNILLRFASRFLRTTFGILCGQVFSIMYMLFDFLA